MCAEALSQGEIDALLRGETPPPPPLSITPEEEDTLKQYTQAVSESGNDTLTTLLGETAETAVGEFMETDSDTVSEDIVGEIVVAELNYSGLIQGKSIVVISLENAMKMASQMTGGGAGDEFGDLEESAFSEAIQSLYSASNTKLGSQLGGEISLEPPEIITKPGNLADLLPESAERNILLTYDLKSGAVEGPIYQIVPKNLLHSISNAASGSAPAAEADADLGFSMDSAPPVMDAPAQFSAGLGDLDLGLGDGGGPEPSVDITNLDLILDIGLEVKVELGRTTRKIREVLELAPGSVIELDRLAGEPVDILVNNKLFAKGEVVVIDENFGVRITDILSIDERIEALK